MSNDSYVTTAQASGEEIATIVNRINVALEGTLSDHMVAACITIAIILQKPDIEGEALSSAITEVSKFIVMLLEAEEGAMVGRIN